MSTSNATRRTNERFRRLEILGRGSMGEVHRAIDRRYGTEVALKTWTIEEEATARDIKREFRRISDILHPNIVPMYDLVVEEGSAFFTMELLRGRQLDPASGWTDASIRRIGAELASALAEIHRHGLLHRDVKLENVIRVSDGRAVLLDFGLACSHGEVGEPGFAGTWAYLAPEILLAGAATAAADVFALGVLLSELALGSRWERDGLEDLLDLTGADPGRMGPHLGQWVRRCLATDPLERPAASELAEALGAGSTLSGASSSAPFLVGRERERAWLEAHIAERRDALVTGPPGIGKTALLGSIGAPRRVLIGGCRPDESVPFNAFDRLAGQLRHALQGAVPPEARALCRLFPDLSSEATSPRDRVPIDEAALGLVWVLDAVGAEVLVLDDLQWADEDSRALLRAVLRIPDRLPLVLACRPCESPDPLSSLVSALPRWELGPLEAGATTTMARELVGEHAPALVPLANGSPLLLTRLARSWRRGQRSFDTAEGLVLAEVRALGDTACVLAQRVAVHQGPLEVEVATHGIGSPDLRTALRRLIQIGVFVFVSPTVVSFAHDSTGEVLHGALGDGERAGLHRALAGGFLARRPTAYAPIALHLWACGEQEQARHPAREAAREAIAAHAWARALRFFDLAFEGAPTVSVSDRRAWSRAAAAAGRVRRAASILESSELLEDEVRMIELHATCGDFGEAEHRLAGLATRFGFSLPQGDLSRYGQGVYWDLRRRWHGLQRSETPVPGAADRCDALWAVTGTLGQYDGLRTFAVQGRHTLEAFASGDPARVIRALVLEASFQDIRCVPGAEVERFDREIEALLQVSDQREEDTAYVRIVGGYRDFCRGRLPEALAKLAAAESFYASRGQWCWERCLGWNYQVFALSHMGRYPEAREHYHTYLDRYLTHDDRASAAVLELGFGVREALLADDVELAERRCDGAVETLPDPLPSNFGFMELQDRVLIDWYAGRSAQAFERVEGAWPQMRPMLTFSVPFGVLWYLYAATGDDARRLSPRQLERAAAALAGNDGPWIRAVRAELEVRVAVHRGGDVGAAVGIALRHAEEASMRGAVWALQERLGLPASPIEGVEAPERYLSLFGW